jgi:hypothetical protein
MKISTCCGYFSLVLLLSANGKTTTIQNPDSITPITNTAVHQTVENSLTNYPLIADTDSLSLDDAHEEISKIVRYQLKFLTHIDELTNLVADGSKLMEAFSYNPEHQETLEKLDTLSKKINSKTNLLEL